MRTASSLSTRKCKAGSGGLKALRRLCWKMRQTADLYVDASGIRSEWLGGRLEEPFLSYGASLFNDRAVVGSWQRGEDEPILPYTTAETMDAGWCWGIEHEHEINRGYVYSSGAISDDAAREEFQRKNPK